MLYGNKLSGTIPSSLGSLTALQYLCVRRAESPHCVHNTEASGLCSQLALS